MKTFFAALVFSIFAHATCGAENIEGAFGLKLGEVFQPENLATGDFTPHPANLALSTYQVQVTPRTHRIYRIVARGQCKGGPGVDRFDAMGEYLKRNMARSPMRFRSVSRWNKARAGSKSKAPRNFWRATSKEA